MKVDIQTFKDLGADGFVFGVLTPEKKVDIENCKTLLASAEGKPCTFHRAFDEISPGEMGEELEVLIELGFRNVLTSGGGRDAVGGREVLKGLVEGAGGRIEVIVGGGVRGGNLGGLRGELEGVRWWHSSAIVDGGEVASEGEVRRLSELLR